jgi:hypothetical protein
MAGRAAEQLPDKARAAAAAAGLFSEEQQQGAAEVFNILWVD